ncbi:MULTISPECIES: type VI secretion system accessory protein TagJ [unclassified Methylobacterium]|uniref:type VI secretion system accessory protein TagJ n=1 Tax=unclassified Methylobacterium TaxID=2615210 RepID=UPI000A4851FF|nr:MULTISPECIES: type VI secretion system accessory protein TagJ [unclassified Methylobacterium]
MTTTDDAPTGLADLLDAGRLDDAIAVASQGVKARPTQAAARLALAELLVLAGALDRAEAQLQVAMEHAPAEATALVAMRHLLRAAVAREAWHHQGALPDFIDGPTARQGEAMRLALAVRAGDAAAAEAARLALEAMPPILAAVDAGAMQEVRDVCDLSQAGFEALTLAGRYLWLAPERVESLVFAPPRRPTDLLWRRAEARLVDGRETTFLVLAQYHDPEAGEAARLARETAWIDLPGGTVRGRGQRVWLVGEAVREFLSLGRVAFAPR